MQTITEGRATAVVINGAVHVLKPSLSSYGLTLNGVRRSYCCQDGCCDYGLRPDVASVVEKAKAFGAKVVIIRTGQRDLRLREIVGLPVEDVSNHVGQIDEGIFISRR